jgi:hypothetical protein
MKWVLIFWGGPIAFLGSWYWLSYYNISFGYFMLTRDAHDLVFQIYGNILGISPEIIPGLVLDVILFDSAIVFGLLALRRHRQIFAGLRRLRDWWRGESGDRARVVEDRPVSSAAETPAYRAHPAE